MPPLKPRPSKLAKALQRVAVGSTVEPSRAPALKAGFNTIATEVQNMHLAISSQTFDALALVPGVSLPAAWVRSAHDAITHGVYSAVRQGGSAALSAAGVAERLMADADADASPSKAQLIARSALNGVFGDALAQAGNALAVRMSLHQQGHELTLTPESLAELRPRVAVFIHGLACDETSWLAQGGAQGGPPDSDYGSALERDLGMSAIYLRYNTGLAVDDNAQALSDLLERLVQAAPARLRELTLIGHSMGGLVARRACAIADSSSATWQRRIGSIICLGTPHQGSGWEKLGHFAAAALNVSAVTKPLARLANARSQGIQDLRRGLKNSDASELTRAPPLRLLTGSLSDDTSSLMGKLASSVLGDGLVAQHSAADDGLTGDVQRVNLAGIGHMALLHDARVEVALRNWLVGRVDQSPQLRA
jgi:pimeloyl-ACP methyl ester carboxylesterase